LLKQKDLSTRIATASLIDELSLGAAFAPEQERVGTELAHFFYSHGSKAKLHPVKSLIWSKLSYVLGIVHPANTGLQRKEELVAQKAFFDTIWDFPLVEVVQTLGDAEPPEKDFDAIATKLNEGSAAHADEIRSFEQVYMHEIEGCLSLYVSTARAILEGMFERATGAPPQSTEDKRRAHEKELLGFFVQCFKKKEVRKQLPTIHVHALCHAAVRWNKRQRIEGNDLFDFHHAAAAIPYCDSFLTESPLRTMLQSKHLGIQADFPCVVISSESEAAQYLESMPPLEQQ